MQNYLLGPETHLPKILKNSFSEGLTQSEIMTRTNCARKWYFRYVRMLRKKGSFSWSLLFGTAVHTMLEQYYGQEDNEPHVPEFLFEDDVILRPDQMEEYDYWKGLALLMVDQHNNHWANMDCKMKILQTEKELEYEYRGFRLRAKIDLVIRPAAKDGVFVLDHKTCSSFDKGLFAGWSFRFQFLFYAWMYWKVTGRYPNGMYVNALKKPQERRSVKKQETIDAFLTRVKSNMELEPDEYFKRERMPFDLDTLPRFEKYTLDPIITQYVQMYAVSNMTERPDFMEQYMIDSLFLSMNTDHCWNYSRPCEFLDLCQNNFNDFSSEYVISEDKHPELRK